MDAIKKRLDLILATVAILGTIWGVWERIDTRFVELNRVIQALVFENCQEHGITDSFECLARRESVMP